MNRLAIPIAVAALAVVPAGCGSDDASATANTTTTAAQPKQSGLPSELAGGYTRFVSKSDIARTQAKRSEVGSNQEKPKPERSLLFFESTGMTARNEKADFVVKQDYS